MVEQPITRVANEDRKHDAMNLSRLAFIVDSPVSASTDFRAWIVFLFAVQAANPFPAVAHSFWTSVDRLGHNADELGKPFREQKHETIM